MSENRPVGRPRKFSPGPLDQVGGMSIFDENETRALINIVPESLKVVMLRIAKTRRHLYFEDERVLKKKLSPDALTCRIRLAFWDEYARAQDKNVMMTVGGIVRGACSPDYFYSYLLKDEKKVAYIICPPVDYMLAMRELLDLGLGEWRDILALPNQSKKGVIDYRLISQKVKIVQMLDLRVKGAIVQKFRNENLNLNVTADAMPALDPSLMSLEELTALENQLERVKALAPAEMLSPPSDLLRTEDIPSYEKELVTIELPSDTAGS